MQNFEAYALNANTYELSVILTNGPITQLDYQEINLQVNHCFGAKYQIENSPRNYTYILYRSFFPVAI